MLINVATVIILIIIGNFLTGAFLAAYHLNLRETPCKKAFFIAKVLQSIGFILIMLRGYIPDIFALLFGNVILIIAVTFETVGLIQVRRPFKESLKTAYLVATPFAVTLFTVVFIWFNTEANRTFVFSLFSGLLLLGTIFTYLGDRKRGHLQTFIAAIHIILFVLLVFRAFNAYFVVFDYSLFSTHWFNQAAFAALFAHMMTVNIGFILLTKQKTDAILVESATIDLLTKIYNRQTFLNRAQTIIAKGRDEKFPVTVWMLDIDNFKNVNDTHGHMIGDQVLTELSSLIKQTLVDRQVFGRFGGDEFASIMAGWDEDAANQYLNGLCKAIAGFTFTEKQLTLSVSIGVVTIVPEKDTNFDTFYRLADEGLYIAKKSSKSMWKRTYLTTAQPTSEASNA